MSQPSHQRIEFVHLLRGIAAAMVYWSHVGAWWIGGSGIPWAPLNWASQHIFDPLRLFQFGGHLGVVLFFLISGFIITKVSQRESPKEFMIKRVCRLWPPIVMAILLTLLVYWLLTSLGLRAPLGVNSTTPTAIVANLFLLSWPLAVPTALTVTWTLFVEIVFYAITAAFIPMSKERPFPATVIALLFVIAVFVPMTWGPLAYTIDVSILIYLPILIAGRCVYLWTEHREWKWLALAGAAWATFLAFFAMKWGGDLWVGQTAPIYTYLWAMAIMAIAMLIPMKKTPQPFQFLGNTSYSLYLLHLPVGSLSMTLLTAAGLSIGSAFAITTAICLAAAWASYKLVELPSQSLGRRLSAARQTRLSVA
ncbi:peptidoglycan/LPS O-acetylase OafA/YrhL [Rhizobium sp. BK181]|uniref:acyltransferase family protein n=1 Tax=Rhizobium sp. BK181 TaxID=2587072 RepID=UPI00161E15E8|nr:acyltransferase [Rhizobium sp. BK181]MBB3315103.1 peptidoglycan/LPS O-acetylase OafA/YrhL [Rhizobium sp. BK181]